MTRSATPTAQSLQVPQERTMHMETKNDSKTTETDVKITDLPFDPKLQLRATPHDGQYITDLWGVIQAGTLTEPIVVFRDPIDGRLRVADGHARVDATRSSGCPTIRARVHEGGFREAFEFALGANATHGARRTNADLRHAVLAALAEPDTESYTNVRIAELCHCSDHFVGELRNELAATSGNAMGARRTGKDGKSYPARRPRKAAVPTGSTPAIRSSVVTSPLPTMTHALASTDRAPRSAATILAGVPTEMSYDARTADVTTPADAVVPTDATEVSVPEVIPSVTTPVAAMTDPVTQIREFLNASKQVRTALPNLPVPQHLESEVHEELVRLHECLRDHGRLTDAQRSGSATPGDRFRARMGYNPSPRRELDHAIVGVFAEELDQERLTA